MADNTSTAYYFVWKRHVPPFIIYVHNGHMDKLQMDGLHAQVAQYCGHVVDGVAFNPAVVNSAKFVWIEGRDTVSS